MYHSLKILPEYFEAKKKGVKAWEHRKNDRGFSFGDTLNLREWDSETEKYTGREMTVNVVYLHDLGNGNIIMSDDSARDGIA